MKTEIFKNGWGGKSARMPVSAKTGMSPELSGERSLYLFSSAQFGGRGVSLPEDVAGGLAVSKTDRGALFLVNEHMECIQQEYVLEQLQLSNAEEKIWQKTRDVSTISLKETFGTGASRIW